MTGPRLYIDFSSPYAYLATMRAERVLGEAVAVQPILLGAIFARRGHGSWADSDRRAAGMADVEARARAYGLHPVVWPARWPANSLRAGRAGIWAVGQDARLAFAQALFGRVFGAGADIGADDTLRNAALVCGLDPDALLAAIATPAVKAALREATEAAWERGVRGVPTLAWRGRLTFGDDRLTEAVR